jgi:predicted DNA-binding transcriptional regulator AlpA
MERYLTTAEAADRVRQAESTLRYWRHVGFGPKSFRSGGRRVLYAESELNEWIEQQRAEEGASTPDGEVRRGPGRPPRYVAKSARGEP